MLKKQKLLNDEERLRGISFAYPTQILYSGMAKADRMENMEK
jgi:hypothetical protein